MWLLQIVKGWDMSRNSKIKNIPKASQTGIKCIRGCSVSVHGTRKYFTHKSAVAGKQIASIRGLRQPLASTVA
jgi:hypothetical protein